MTSLKMQLIDNLSGVTNATEMSLPDRVFLFYEKEFLFVFMDLPRSYGMLPRCLIAHGKMVN